MKKITTKIAALLMFTMTAFQVNAQAFNNEDGLGEGMYRIQIQGTNVCMSLPNNAPIIPGESQQIIFQEVDVTKNEQVFNVTQALDEDGEPLVNFFKIESVVNGKGVVEVLDISELNPRIGVKGNLDGDITNGADNWNPTRGMGTQLFLGIKIVGSAFENASLRRVQNAELGANAMLSGGTPSRFDWVRVETLDTTLSTSDELASKSLKAFPNPSSDGVFNLTVETGYTVYSLLGKQVLKGSGTSVNLSGLSKGLYILKTDAGQTVRLIF